jgi:hypothetical protein
MISLLSSCSAAHTTTIADRQSDFFARPVVAIWVRRSRPAPSCRQIPVGTVQTGRASIALARPLLSEDCL